MIKKLSTLSAAAKTQNALQSRNVLRNRENVDAQFFADLRSSRVKKNSVDIADKMQNTRMKPGRFANMAPSTPSTKFRRIQSQALGDPRAGTGIIQATQESAGAMVATSPGMVTRHRRSGDVSDSIADSPINFKAIRRRIERERIDACGDPFAAPDWRVPLKPRERDSVWNMTGGRCVYCGVQTNRERFGTFQVDHVIPVSFGGTNDPKNLVPACKSCNASKAYYTVEEFRANQGIDLFWFEREGIEL